MKGTIGTSTVVYLGNYFEWTGSSTSMKKYYYAAGQRVAMRQGSSTLRFLLGDHLGSTSLTVTTAGGEAGELRYYPWGGTRYTSGTTLTSFHFTGQREQSEIGLYFYGARWYDAALGRFVQADSIIPRPGMAVAWDRYAYTANNPVRYSDPSGHGYCNSDNAAEDVDCSYTAQNILEEFYEVTFENGNMQWTNEEISAVYMAVMAVGAKTGQVLQAVNDIVLTAGEAFQGIYGNVTFLRGNRRADGSTNGLSEECAGIGTGGCTSSSSLINIVSWGSTMLRRRNTATHELGHAFSGTSVGRDAYSVLGDAMKNDPLLRRDNPLEGYSYGFASGYNFMIFQMSYTNASSSNEIFADMFVGWVTNAWFTGSYPPGWGVDMGYETATHIDMAEAKSSWINNYMNTTIP